MYDKPDMCLQFGTYSLLEGHGRNFIVSVEPKSTVFINYHTA